VLQRADWGTVYECREAPLNQFCGMEGFKPDGTNAGEVWTALGSCTGTIAPTTAPSFDAAADLGCPEAYEVGTDYQEEDYVAVTSEGSSRGVVYKCREAPLNQFCGTFQPDSVHGQDAWEVVGMCSGTVAPTAAPSFDAASDAGCPEAYQVGTEYDAADSVSVTADGSSRGVVYTCKEAPLNRFCGREGYQPDGTHGGDAWTLVGFCSGTVAPTASPIFEALEDLGGCPEEWEEGGIDKYEEGDQASVGQLVFTCAGWPYSAHCGRIGYQPLTEGNGDAWMEAWTIAGHCSGTITPTASPSFDPANVVGCPPNWTDGEEYEEGGMAAVTISETPERKVAYVCNAWPLNQFCGRFSPNDEIGGSQGWTRVAPCDGTLTGSPTSSPSFDALTEVTGGCPGEYELSDDEYEAGDRVTYTVSVAPVRKIVFECKTFPNSGYCNQEAFAPGAEHADRAWILKGYCEGTTAPTLSPVAYTGTCEYTKEVSESEGCTCGDFGCPNPGGLPATSAACEKTVMTTATETVAIYSSSIKYVTADVVRLGVDRFKCKPWPFHMWCSNDAYQPSVDSDGPWKEAWLEDGVCT